MSPFNVSKVNKLIEKLTEVVESPQLCSQPSVSVSLVTYNHEKYFRNAIESALNQITDFDFEIVVGEDSSSDKTFQLALEYHRQFPNIVRILHSISRLGKFTKSGRYNHIRNMLSCRGEYVAHLEGDDYWTCPHKLQRQVEYLREAKSAAGSFHRSQTVDCNGNVIDDFFKRVYKKKYTQEECLTRLYSGYASCSLMFRRACIGDGLPDYFYGAGSDYLLDIAITENGTLDYLPIDGAAYRIHDAGIWQGNLPSKNCEVVLNRILVLSQSREMINRYETQLKERLDYHLTEYVEALRNDYPNVFQRIIAASNSKLGFSVSEKIALLRRVLGYNENNVRSAA